MLLLGAIFYLHAAPTIVGIDKLSKASNFMFGSILYYIIALLIYSTYQPVKGAPLSFFQPFILFVIFFLIFAALTRYIFKKIKSRIESSTYKLIDHQFQSALTQQSIFAIMLYALDIHVLNIVSLLNRFPVFQKIPTLEALIFLLLFMFYLSVVWGSAYGSYQKIYKTGMTRNEYVISNLSFSLPALLPWLVLSLMADLINSLPFESFKRFLSSTEGQVLYFAFFLFVVAIIGPAFIQKFWRCYPLNDGIIRSRIESMCRKMDMKYKDILIWPLFGGKMITAGVMGLIQQFRYILITPALIDLLDPIEIDAVIAHEIGHIKQKHLLLYLFFFVGYLIIAFSIFDPLMYLLFYIEAAYGFIEAEPATASTFISLSFSVSTILIFLIYFRYIFGFFMRNFERQADIYAYTAIGTPQPLISSFEKISISSGQSPEKPNWHHFSIQKRISYLIKCASDRTWIDRHNSKVKKSILIYLISLTIIGWMGFSIHFGEAGETINSKILKKVISKRIEIEPNNANLYQILGDLYYSEKDYENTINSYQKALKYNLNQKDALNNLAWLYATCDDKRYRWPSKAVELAEHAAAVSNESHILDTLAEAYYVDGNINAAVEAGEKALSIAADNHSYYQNQLSKFKQTAALQQSRQ